MGADCPSDEEFVRFLEQNDVLDPARCDWISSHLNACDPCSDRLDDLIDRLPDGLLDWHRDALKQIAGLSRTPTDPGRFDLGDAADENSRADELGRRNRMLPPLGHPLEHGARIVSDRSVGMLGTGDQQRVVVEGETSSRYRRLRLHAKGGLGNVFVAQDEELNREVALKEIRSQFSRDPASRSRFLSEAEITGGLEHPGIVPIYGVGRYGDGRPFYTMRFVKGASLKEAIESYHKVHPRPDPAAVEFRNLLGRFVDVCQAIAFAHSKGVLHRDLKPHNVMLGEFGETLLIDWGLARTIRRRESIGPKATGKPTLVPPSDSEHAPTLGVVGTPPYMSPEQAAGEAESLGPATDVYGLGAILFALLTAEPPVEGKTTEEILDRVRRGLIRSPRSLNPRVPRALEAVCLKAIAHKLEDRYTTAQVLAEEVERWLADEPVSAWREPLTLRAGRWARKHQTALVTGTTAATVAALVFGGFAWAHRPAQ